MAQKYTWVFPGQSPTSLKADPFLGARILDKCSDTLLRQAEGKPHPWRYLLGVVGLPSCCYELFRSAESVSVAMDKMDHRLYGGATLNRVVVDEMIRRRDAKDVAGATKCAKQQIAAMILHGLWTPVDNEELASLESEVQVSLRKRYGKNFETRSIPTAVTVDPDAYVMLANWLKWGHTGLPGLSYYTDQAMADLLAEILRKQGHVGLYQMSKRLHYFRTLRRQLGLVHAYPRKPIVTKVRKKNRDGTFDIAIETGRRTEFRNLGHDLMTVGPQQVYPVPMPNPLATSGSVPP